jgi:hypothetical protein
MEVHHHPQVEKKNFKEYFFEFLMIFLAVTLGFFAETIRESINEHERAREFATLMVKDLINDTSELAVYRHDLNYGANNIDTFMQILSKDDPNNIPSGKLYWYGLFGSIPRFFIPNDATFQQMKSSGSLRYFDKTIGTDAAKYDRLCRFVQNLEQSNLGIYTEGRKCRALIFASKYLEVANIITRIPNNRRLIDSFMKTNPPLLSSDKVLFNQYVELSRSRFLHRTVAFADSLIKQATILLGELEKNYKPDN